MTTLVDTQTPTRMNPVHALRHSMTLTWRFLVKARRNPESFFDVTVQPIIFTVLFVFIFGGAISGNLHNYLQFLLAGMLVQNTIFLTIGTGLSLNNDIDKGVFDRFRSLPIARSSPLIGAVLGDALRYALSMVILIGFAAILGFNFTNGFLGTVAAALVVLGFALALCWVWVWLGLTMKKPQGVQAAGFPVMMLLTFGSNVFVPANTMPGWLQAFVNVNPVHYLVDASRGLMLGGPVAKPLLVSALWAVGLLVVFVPLALRAYRRRT
jgi:oleandomycin transport system permease protein